MQPRVVVVEYNAALRPPIAVVADYDENFVWDGTSYYGASLKALESLASQKGYDLVGCSLSCINAFFVKRDLVGDKFCAPFTAENHMHPPGIGNYQKV